MSSSTASSQRPEEATLSELDVVLLDCQTTNATPELGDLLELGWAIHARDGTMRSAHSTWLVPRSTREISRAVRRLTGFDETCLATAITPEDAWSRLRKDMAGVPHVGERVPAVIHFARFELTFLRDLQQRIEGEAPFPIDAVCLHRIAQRLYPNLPRRGLRALAGYLGHSAELARRCAGHVEATAFIWRTVVPALAEIGVRTFGDLKTWLEETSPSRSSRGQKRVFPMPIAARRALPDGPGVYRFVRSNGDVLYVGKAVSVKKRVASHFSGAARASNERTLEMLTQAADVTVVPTATVLEAALLEADEIKRLDPPYNVQLRERDRRAWFASADLRTAVSVPDATHRIGPLPSSHALSEIAAVRALAEGATPTTELLASAMGVPVSFAPPAALFAEIFSEFARAHLKKGSPWLALQRASKKIRVVARDEEQDGPPSGWDRERVRRWLDRAVVRGVHLVRRARWLCILSDAVIAFREPDATSFRLLSCDGAVLAPARDFSGDAPLPAPPAKRTAHARRLVFDAARYDRLRVLATELRRVHDEGGEVRIRVGEHVILQQKLRHVL